MKGSKKMNSTIIATRKYNKEQYTFILNTPSFEGEKGACGIEIKPYIIVKAPDNCFGYDDTFIYNDAKNTGYFLHRYHPNWIITKIITVCSKLSEKHL
jgi:hypothetical protein